MLKHVSFHGRCLLIVCIFHTWKVKTIDIFKWKRIDIATVNMCVSIHVTVYMLLVNYQWTHSQNKDNHGKKHLSLQR